VEVKYHFLQYKELQYLLHQQVEVKYHFLQYKELQYLLLII